VVIKLAQQHHRTSHKAWEIRLKPASGGVVVGDPVQDNRSVNDAVQAGIRTAMKAAKAPRRNAGAAASEITCESWLTDGISGSIDPASDYDRKRGRRPPPPSGDGDRRDR
jgi:hypothetical protein